MKTSDVIKAGLRCHAAHWNDEDCPTKEGYEHCPLENGYHDPDELMADALEQIEELEKKVPQWISVKERLPEASQDRVLVLTESGNIFDITYDCCIDDVKERFGEYVSYYHPDTLGFVDGEWHPYEGITHWMPLYDMPLPEEEENG